jgi:AcrR family transcriptional regulator
MTAKRWERRKENRAPEILEAALACFAENGFAGTRMEDIAARAKITKGTIYLYFQGKEELFKALARASIGAQMDDVKARAEAFEGKTADLLRFVLATAGHFVSTSDRVVLPKVLLAEAGKFPELAEFWRREVIDRGIGLFKSIIARGQTRGEFRAVEPEHAARLCIAPFLIVMFWRTTFARFDDAPYDYQGLIDTHLDMLLRGLVKDGAVS